MFLVSHYLLNYIYEVIHDRVVNSGKMVIYAFLLEFFSPYDVH